MAGYLYQFHSKTTPKLLNTTIWFGKCIAGIWKRPRMQQFLTNSGFIRISCFANTLSMIIPWCCRSYENSLVMTNSSSCSTTCSSSEPPPRKPYLSTSHSLVVCSPHGFYMLIWCCCSNPGPQFELFAHFNLDMDFTRQVLDTSKCISDVSIP